MADQRRYYPESPRPAPAASGYDTRAARDTFSRPAPTPQPRIRPDNPPTPPAGTWTPTPLQSPPPAQTQRSWHEVATSRAHDLAAMFGGDGPMDAVDHANAIHDTYRWRWE